MKRRVARYHVSVTNDPSEALSQEKSSFDLRSLPADFYENPFPYYAELRADSPIKRLPDGRYF